jgi:UDP-N-acetylmuramoylalanine--D-glutamate ligase
MTTQAAASILDPREVLPTRVAILGAGASGIATAKLCDLYGLDVFVSDTGDAQSLEAGLHAHGLAHLPHEAGQHTGRVLTYDCMVVSPGIRPDTPIIAQARARNIPVTTEIDIAFAISRTPMLAVTGTSGKTTVVTMLAHILDAAGIRSMAAGNIGTPLIQAVQQYGPADCLAVEVSSFQLLYAERFAPAGAALLNIGKNHLDWHADMDEYIGAKQRIARHMGSDAFLVCNGDDTALVEWGKACQERTTVIWAGAHAYGANRVQVTNEGIVGTRDGTAVRLAGMDAVKVRGAHNAFNASVAAAMAWWYGIPADAITEGLSRFQGLPHRLAYVDTIDGVSYYNDSKATTAESVATALQSFDAPVYLIAGGKDKGCGFSGIGDTVGKKVTHAFLIGEAAARIESEWKDRTAMTRCASLHEAVDRAAHAARPGSIVLLSPGCSSFDMFDNYAHRGKCFIDLVHRLRNE